MGIGNLGLNFCNLIQSRLCLELKKSNKLSFVKKRIVLLSFMSFFDLLKKAKHVVWANKFFLKETALTKPTLLFTKTEKAKLLPAFILKKLETLLGEYKKRWSIEVGFKNLKSNGFNIEETSLTCSVRLQNLMHVVLVAFGVLVKKALSHQEVCKAFSLAEASQTNEPKQNHVPHLRESFFKKVLTHLPRDLILQRSKTLQKFLSTLIEALQSLEN
jgi:transposase